jgi:predicted ABC-type ATPase
MKRMRVFAGPNGSGKSTMVNYVIENGPIQYHCDLINPKRHINPDDLNLIDVLNFGEFGLNVDETTFRDSILQSPFFRDCNINIKDIRIEDNSFKIPNQNSYVGSMLAEFLKSCYINSNEELFSYETVFSHPSKVQFLKDATDLGWRVYLYFVCTESPDINCGRVESRWKMGGHCVPKDKIIARYTRSLENLFPALHYCDRAYMFDNTKNIKLVAEKFPDNTFELREMPTPSWLNEHVLSKFQ